MNTVRHSSALASLFDRNVAARECLGLASLDALHAEEAALVARAVPDRKAMFAAGRLCAKAALQEISAHAGPILWDRARAPVWPQDVVGSITHTAGFCGAVVAEREVYGGIGIDAERRASVHEEIWDQILTPVERKRLLALDPLERSEVATTIFSIKEAFYKAQYQVTGGWLGFEGAEVQLMSGEFVLELLLDVEPLSREARFKGKYAVLPAIVVAGIALPSVPAAARHSGG